MKIVITGGAGFIGLNLVQYLATTEPTSQIIVADIVTPKMVLPENASYLYLDVRDPLTLVRAFEGVDEVYHFAGVLGTSELLDTPALAAEINITGTVNVLEAARLSNVKRVYNVAKPHFESYSENIYTTTKHSGEIFGSLYKKNFNMSVASLRWMNAVGPYQHLFPVRKFVPTMILLAMYGYNLEVYGDGKQSIDPIDTRDLSMFTVYACRNLGKSESIVDLGSGQDIACKDAAEIILKLTPQLHDLPRGKGSRIVHSPMRRGERPGVNIVADMSYWDQQGMQPRYSFEDSVTEAIAYIEQLPRYEKLNALKFYGLI